MYGPPKDKPNECNARLFIGDDWGDNRSTMRCQLPSGHKGRHQEKYKSDASGLVKITWVKDARFTCERHGIQADDHCHKCDDAPVMCSVHGMQDSYMCFKCSDEGNFVCPVHGEQDNPYGCHEDGCEHPNIDERWTKVYDVGLPDVSPA